mgnify:CR=1 FL=1
MSIAACVGGSCNLGRSFVYLLKAFSSFFGTAAGDVLAKLNDDAVVNDPIDGGGVGHRVFEDAIPFGEHKIGSNDHAAAFVSFGQEGKEYFHLFSALLDVADLVDNQGVVAAKLNAFNRCLGNLFGRLLFLLFF